MRDILKDYHINIIAEAENGSELLKQLETLNPDVILLDLAMPVMDGTETMQRLMENHPKKKVIIMSQFEDATLMSDYKMRGAKGCFPKSEVGFRVGDLVSAIRTVHKGGSYFNFEEGASPLQLSIRQKELVTMFGDQMKTKDIAAQLNVGTTAVTKQRQKIMKKLNVDSVADLYKKIYSQGLNYFRKPRKNDDLGKRI